MKPNKALGVIDGSFHSLVTSLPCGDSLRHIESDINTYNPFRIAFHEWYLLWKDVRRPLSLKHRLAYVFGPPGWSHDGSRKTTRQLRDEWQAQQAQAREPVEDGG